MSKLYTITHRLSQDVQHIGLGLFVRFGMRIITLMSKRATKKPPTTPLALTASPRMKCTQNAYTDYLHGNYTKNGYSNTTLKGGKA